MAIARYYETCGFASRGCGWQWCGSKLFPTYRRSFESRFIILRRASKLAAELTQVQFDLPRQHAPNGHKPSLLFRQHFPIMDHPDHVKLLARANLSRGGTWADFGAGAGAFTLALRELLGSEAEIYAVDRDRRQLAELDQDYRKRFGDPAGLHLLPADFTRNLELPPLDGILMANSLHFFKDKEKLLRKLGVYLRPKGMLLLVEYSADSGNPWVPYPLTFETYSLLAPLAGFSKPRLLATNPSRFLKEFYSALAIKMENA
jgi:ubiquinone/menaquinone biosynthesis C-methylase UbiE